MKKFLIMCALIVIFPYCYHIPAATTSPQETLNEALFDLNNKKPKGELFAWITVVYINNFVNGYLAYNDTAWLDAGIKYYDFALSKRETTYDGYKGWIGIYGGDEVGLIGEAFVSDAQVFKGILSFCEVVSKDAALKAKYGKKAEEYLLDAKKQLIDKWDSRGCYFQDGGFAAYGVQTTWWDENKKIWFERQSERRTENLNKHATMASCFMKIYRITKEPMYFDRAEKIFSHYKQIMRWDKKEDRYIWNFWEPFMPFDMAGKPKSWVDVHPSRPGYQAMESADLVEAYHTGVVFDEADMKRLVNTNIWMWNKSAGKPVFKSSDGATEAGALWSALADFDPVIRQLTGESLKKGKSIDYALFLKVTCKEPPAYKRKYVSGDVKLPKILLYPDTDLSMAVAIPAHISLKNDEVMKICCKAKVKGKLSVDLFSPDGKNLVMNLFKEELKRADEFYTQKWKGESTVRGNYRIRWTLNDSIAERPVKIED